MKTKKAKKTKMTKMIIGNKEAAISCIQYILAHEEKDYHQWCEENGRDYFGDNPHVYSQALRALEWDGDLND